MLGIGSAQTDGNRLGANEVGNFVAKRTRKPAESKPDLDLQQDFREYLSTLERLSLDGLARADLQKPGPDHEMGVLMIHHLVEQLVAIYDAERRGEQCDVTRSDLRRYWTAMLDDKIRPIRRIVEIFERWAIADAPIYPFTCVRRAQMALGECRKLFLHETAILQGLSGFLPLLRATRFIAVCADPNIMADVARNRLPEKYKEAGNALLRGCGSQDTRQDTDQRLQTPMHRVQNTRKANKSTPKKTAPKP